MLDGIQGYSVISTLITVCYCAVIQYFAVFASVRSVLDPRTSTIFGLDLTTLLKSQDQIPFQEHLPLLSEQLTRIFHNSNEVQRSAVRRLRLNPHKLRYPIHV